MLINEIFGPTIQGEGHLIGQKAIFIRTAGCDYRCAWCDTKHAWGNEAESLTPTEIYNKVVSLCGLYNCSNVVITGGNPCLIGKEMEDLIKLLQENFFSVSVETQGSMWKEWLLLADHVIISPKPPSSGVDTNWHELGKLRDELYLNHCNEYTFSVKVVVFTDVDYKYAQRVHDLFEDTNYAGFYLQVGNNFSDSTSLPKSMITEMLLDKLGWLVSKVVNDPQMNDARVLPQLHTLIWGNKRGV